ncbi:hypothetical protein ONZ45_g12053 [Pleurotus djamor]|nr:hypothetical protein ONZ45_g12053 [Pleurotus djamor]
MKKLHVDRPENVDANQVDDGAREADLLRSLCLLLGETTPEEDIETVSNEVTSYLEGKADDACLSLRKAKDGLLQFHKLKRKREKDRSALSKMTKLLSTALERAEEDSKLSKSIEQSLLLKIDILTSFHSECESTIDKLRSDLSKYQYTTNPLPKPPEPIPLDRFPAFARAAAAGFPSSPKQSTTGTSIDLGSNATSTLDEYVSPDPMTRAEIAARDRESAEKLQAQEAQRREQIAQRKQKQPLYNVHRYATNASTSARRSDVIPGASPNQRVIPGTSSQDLASSASAPASAYIDGYAHGYGYGYNYAPVVGISMSQEGLENNASSSRSSPPADATPRLGLGLYGVPSSANTQTTQRRERASDYTLLQPPQTAPTVHTSSRPHGNHRSSRSRRDSLTVDGHATDSTLVLAHGSSGTHRSRRRSSRATQPTQTLPPEPEPPAVATPASITSNDRASISSWGTVTSNQVPGSSGSSVADLRLPWFPPGTGTGVNVPSETSARDPLFPFGARQHENGTEGARSSTTHTNSVDATPRASDRQAVANPLETLSMLLETNTSLGSRHARVVIEDRPRHSRHSTLPDSALRTATSSGTSSVVQESATSSRDHSRRRHHRRRHDSTSAAARPAEGSSVPPIANIPNITSAGIVDEGYLSDAQPALSQSFGNALGLDLTEEPQSTGLVISAPTPIVSTRNFLRSWSMDH